MAKRPGRHRFDFGALLAGLFFLAISSSHLWQALGRRAGLPLEVIAPTVLIGLGVVGIALILTRSRRRAP